MVRILADTVSRLTHVSGGRPVLALVWIVMGFVAAGSQAETTEQTGVKTSLLIIDVQAFYFTGGALPLHEPEAASLNCKKLLSKFREENQMVVHVGHKVSEGGAFHQDVEPLEGEKIVMKDEVSAFNGTPLLQYLQNNGVERLVICGMQTHMCVEAAVRAAHDLGFDCILVQDACATKAVSFEERTVEAADVHSSTLGTLNRTYAKVVDTKTYLESPR